MKKLALRFLAVMAVAITTAVSALGQNGFAYQAVIRDANGELVTNKQVEVKVTLKHDGASCYTETQTVTTNEYGNIQVVVGNGKKVDRKRLLDADGNRFATKTAAARARKAAIEHAVKEQQDKQAEQQRVLF